MRRREAMAGCIRQNAPTRIGALKVEISSQNREIRPVFLPPAIQVFEEFLRSGRPQRPKNPGVKTRPRENLTRTPVPKMKGWKEFPPPGVPRVVAHPIDFVVTMPAPS